MGWRVRGEREAGGEGEGKLNNMEVFVRGRCGVATCCNVVVCAVVHVTLCDVRAVY